MYQSNIYLKSIRIYPPVNTCRPILFDRHSFQLRLISQIKDRGDPTGEEEIRITGADEQDLRDMTYYLGYILKLLTESDI